MEITFLEGIRQGIWEEMERDPNVFLIGEDIGVYGGAFKVTVGMLDHFGERRVVDTPVCESAIAGATIGAALMGLRPVAEMQFADFISCCFDQIVNMAATLRYRHGGTVSCPIVIRAPSGANIHGGIFHSQNPEAWFFHQPGLKIVAPATAYDAKGLLKAAIRDDDPVLYFENKYLYRRAKSEVPEGDYVVPLGKAEVRREGQDITVVAYGVTVHQSLAAAEQVAGEGISVEEIDLRSLVPMDKEAIFNSVRKTSKVLVTHEAARRGGVGAEIAALIAEELFDYLDGPVMRVASENIPVPFSPPLEEFCLPNAEKIAAALRKLALY